MVEFKPEDSRAIARDIGQPPFTKLPFKDQTSIRRMFGKEILTFAQYIAERDKLVSLRKPLTAVDLQISQERNQKNPFSPKIKEFIQSVSWTFAKTMPQWPHEYIVRHEVDKTIFLEMAEHIMEFGSQGYFYEKSLTFFNEDGKVYWTLGDQLKRQ